MLGVPVVGLATTEMVTVIRDGQSGFLDTDVEALIQKMKLLLADRNLARKLGAEGQRIALKRFNIGRFTNDWYELLTSIISGTGPTADVSGASSPDKRHLEFQRSVYAGK